MPWASGREQNSATTHFHNTFPQHISNEWPYKRREIEINSTVWDFEMWPLAVLRGDRINAVFHKEIYGRFS